MEEITGRIIRAYKECHVPEHVDISAVLDFESVKDRICYKLVNADWNKERLSGIPYMAFHDLALIPYKEDAREYISRLCHYFMEYMVRCSNDEEL